MFAQSWLRIRSVCPKSLWLPLSPLVAILSFTLHSGKSPGNCDINDYENLIRLL